PFERAYAPGRFVLQYASPCEIEPKLNGILLQCGNRDLLARAGGSEVARVGKERDEILPQGSWRNNPAHSQRRPRMGERRQELKALLNAGVELINLLDQWLLDGWHLIPKGFRGGKRNSRCPRAGHWRGGQHSQNCCSDPNALVHARWACCQPSALLKFRVTLF